MQTISDTYADDHDRLDALFQDYTTLKQSNRQRARQVFSIFKAGLERHIAWEEEILFPRFEKATGLSSGGPTEVMRLEHLSIKHWLREIETKWEVGLPSDDEEASLVEVLCPHNHKEEVILYPAIDQTLTAEEVEHVRAAMERSEKKSGGCGCSCSGH